MTNAFLAKKGFEKFLLEEIGDSTQYDELFVSEFEGSPLWAINVWRNVQRVNFESIGQAAKLLREYGRNWALYPYKAYRRSLLIQDKLPYLSNKPLEFGIPAPQAPLGSWTLLDNNTLLFSHDCSSPFANGEPKFLESKIPPSRAYLKLYEALTHYGTFPKPGDKALEIGASPGSWTWALKNLGCDVIANDRSPLEIPHDNFIQGDAFSLTSDKIGDVDWIFSDVICYPEKLYEWVVKWQGHAKHFITTIKLQGDHTQETIEKFRKLGEVKHLFYNKHELTFFLRGVL